MEKEKESQRIMSGLAGLEADKCLTLKVFLKNFKFGAVFSFNSSPSW
jgi:hypothetical protein